jgi:hypothetical protein
MWERQIYAGFVAMGTCLCRLRLASDDFFRDDRFHAHCMKPPGVSRHAHSSPPLLNRVLPKRSRQLRLQYDRLNQ